MPVSPILRFLQIAETQSEKIAAFNTIIGEVEKTIADTYTLVTTAGTSVYTIPFDDTSDLGDKTALRFVRMVINGTADGSFTVEHPQYRHLFFVRNDTNFNATFSAGGSDVVVGPQTGQIIYCDGSDFNLLLTETRLVAADFQFNYFGNPGPSEVIADIMVARDTTILDNLTGLVGNTGSNPTGSSVVFDVLENGSAFGTITVNTSGQFSANTTGGNQVINAGNRLQIRAPATPNPGVSDIQIAIPATALL